MNARVGYVGNGFSFTPLGGDASAYRDSGRVRRGNYYLYSTDRPDYSAHVDGNWFRGSHEITFGGSWRNTKDDEFLEYPGNGVDSLHNADFADHAADAGADLAAVLRIERGGRPTASMPATPPAGPPDGQCRVAIRSQHGVDARKRPARQPGIPGAAAGDRRAGRGQLDRLQPAVAAHRRQLRAGRQRPHAAARQLWDVRQPAWVRHGAGFLGGVARDSCLLRPPIETATTSPIQASWGR